MRGDREPATKGAKCLVSGQTKAGVLKSQGTWIYVNRSKFLVRFRLRFAETGGTRHFSPRKQPRERCCALPSRSRHSRPSKSPWRSPLRPLARARRCDLPPLRRSVSLPRVKSLRRSRARPPNHWSLWLAVEISVRARESSSPSLTARAAPRVERSRTRVAR